jgi:hypothetical protein
MPHISRALGVKGSRALGVKGSRALGVEGGKAPFCFAPFYIDGRPGRRVLSMWDRVNMGKLLPEVLSKAT